MTHIAAGLFFGLIYGIIVTYIVDKMIEPYKYIKFIYDWYNFYPDMNIDIDSMLT